MGRSGDLVVGILDFQSGFDSCGLLSFTVFLYYEKTKVNEKEAGNDPSFKKVYYSKASCFSRSIV